MHHLSDRMNRGLLGDFQVRELTCSGDEEIRQDQANESHSSLNAIDDPPTGECNNDAASQRCCKSQRLSLEFDVVTYLLCLQQRSFQGRTLLRYLGLSNADVRSCLLCSLCLLTGSKMSAKIVCPATRKNGPVVPPMTQMAVKQAKLLDNADPIEHRVNREFASRYAVLRPRMLLVGSQIKADRAMAMKTPALAVLIACVETPKSAATSFVAVKIELPEKVTGRAIQQTTNNVTHLRQVGISMTTSSTAAGRAGSDAAGMGPESGSELNCGIVTVAILSGFSAVCVAMVTSVASNKSTAKRKGYPAI